MAHVRARRENLFEKRRLEGEKPLSVRHERGKAWARRIRFEKSGARRHVCPILGVEFDEEGNQLTSASEINNWVASVEEDGYDEEDE